MVFRDFCESGWGRAGAGWAGREGWAGRVGWAGQAGHVGGAGLRGRCTKERIFVHLLCPPGGGQTNEWMNEWMNHLYCCKTPVPDHYFQEEVQGRG